MWSFLSNAAAERLGSTSTCRKSSSSKQDCSDDEVSSCASKSLECPICWELFNIVENVPHVLWCGHTLCKNCVLSLQWAVVKLQTLPLQLLLLVSCPWCSRLSLRLVYNGNIMFPRKNYFLLWMVESMNGERLRSQSLTAGEQRPGNMLSGRHAYQQQNGQTTPHTHGQNSNSNQIHTRCTGNYFTTERIHASLFKSLAFFIQLTAKFPLILIFLLIILYAVPASAVILTLIVHLATSAAFDLFEALQIHRFSSLQSRPILLMSYSIDIVSFFIICLFIYLFSRSMLSCGIAQFSLFMAFTAHVLMQFLYANSISSTRLHISDVNDKFVPINRVVFVIDTLLSLIATECLHNVVYQCIYNAIYQLINE